jgi:hypothetical protein
MRRIFALAALVALTLGMLAPSLVSAQPGTPAAETTSGFGIPAGTAVSYIGSDGAEIGTITVGSITDPFDGYDASSAPQRGYHYALAEITVTNTSNRPFEVNPGSFLAIDSDGFVAEQGYVTFTDPSLIQLEYSDALAPGDSVTGVIPYSLFGESTIEGIIYSPSYDRVITVLDQRAAPVDIGSTVSIMNTAGAETAQVVVNSVTAPFEGYDASSAPARGSSYVAVEVTVTNTGTGVLSVSPSDFWVIDRDGFVLSSTYVTRTDTTIPDYDYIDLNPGESQHGMLVYQIYEGVPVQMVAYGDGYTAFQVVADVANSATTGVPAIPAQPVATATTVAGAEATASTGVVTSSPECAGLTEWALDMFDRISRAAELLTPLQTADTSTLDVATLRDAATQLRTLGDEQGASNPPAAAVELNTLVTEQFYYAMADKLEEGATALEQNNAAGVLTAQMGAQQVTQIFDDGGAYDQAAQGIATACPAEYGSVDS